LQTTEKREVGYDLANNLFNRCISCIADVWKINNYNTFQDLGPEISGKDDLLYLTFLGVRYNLCNKNGLGKLKGGSK